MYQDIAGDESFRVGFATFFKSYSRNLHHLPDTLRYSNMTSYLWKSNITRIHHIDL